MILHSIELNDFRSFRGKSKRIELARLPRAKITVFHGEMGHGKTTMLNAFRWVLHGGRGVSNRFEDPNSIINTRVADVDPQAESSVKLQFSHLVPGEGEVSVTVLRKINQSEQREANPRSPANGRIELTVTHTNQSSQPIQKMSGTEAQNYINCIIPEGILDILFFDGEGIDMLATKNQNSQMDEAVRTILGFGVIERAISDLKDDQVLGYFEAKRNSSVEESLKSLYAKEKILQKQLSTLDVNNDDSISEKSRLEVLKNKLDLDLRKLADVRVYLERRAGYEDQLKSEKIRHEKSLLNLKLFIRKNAHSIISGRLVQDGLRLERELRDKGKFPPPVMYDYVKELLERKLCMCERPLEVPSTERSCVEKMLHVARDREFHDSAAGVGKMLSTFNLRLQVDRTELRRLRDDCVMIEGNCRQLQSNIDNESARIVGLNIDEITNLESERDGYITNIATIKAEIRDLLEYKIPQKKGEIEENKREIAKQESILKVDDEIKTRVLIINETIKKLNEMLESRAAKLEILLQDKVNKHFQDLIDIESRASVRRVRGSNNKSDSFHIDIMQRNASGGYDVETGVNTGKRKCLSFAFIKSLVEFASEEDPFRDGLDSFIQPEEYPIVMDAPFGAIDDLASKKISAFLPSFAKQLICLVNTPNYKQVAAALDDNINTGRRYVIFHYYPTGSDKTARKISVTGRDVEVASVANDNLGERAEIRDISQLI